MVVVTVAPAAMVVVMALAAVKHSLSIR